MSQKKAEPFGVGTTRSAASSKRTAALGGSKGVTLAACVCGNTPAFPAPALKDMRGSTSVSRKRSVWVSRRNRQAAGIAALGMGASGSGASGDDLHAPRSWRCLSVLPNGNPRGPSPKAGSLWQDAARAASRQKQMIRKSVIRFTITEICRRQTPLRPSLHAIPLLNTPCHKHFACQNPADVSMPIATAPVGRFFHVAPDTFVRGRSGRKARFRLELGSWCRLKRRFVSGHVFRHATTGTQSSLGFSRRRAQPQRLKPLHLSPSVASLKSDALIRIILFKLQNWTESNCRIGENWPDAARSS